MTVRWYFYAAVAVWAIYAASGGSLAIWRKPKRRRNRWNRHGF